MMKSSQAAECPANGKANRGGAVDSWRDDENDDENDDDDTDDRRAGASCSPALSTAATTPSPRACKASPLGFLVRWRLERQAGRQAGRKKPESIRRTRIIIIIIIIITVIIIIQLETRPQVVGNGER